MPTRPPVTLPPWEYLFTQFNRTFFPDIYDPIWIAALVCLGLAVAGYAIRTRQLRHHPPFTRMYEWMLWTCLSTFGLVVVCAVFQFDFIFVLATLAVGLGFLAWVRFNRFPPDLAAWETRLARERFYTSRKFAHPEATIRPRRRRRRR
jgi:hypothetical protein